MNRRDAIKAAVAGVAGAMVPQGDAVPPCKLMKLSVPPIGTPWPPNEPTLTNIEGWYVYRHDGDRLHDMTAKFSDGSTFKVRTDEFDAKWFVSLVGQPKTQCVKELMQGHTYWTVIYGDRWMPTALKEEA